MVCTLTLLAHTFLVGLLQIHDLSVVSGSKNLNQGVLISSKPLRQRCMNRSIKTWKGILENQFKLRTPIKKTRGGGAVGSHYNPGITVVTPEAYWCLPVLILTKIVGVRAFAFMSTLCFFTFMASFSCWASYWAGVFSRASTTSSRSPFKALFRADSRGCTQKKLLLHSGRSHITC